MEVLKVEKEKEIKFEFLTAKELEDIIYKGESLPQDPRFFSTEEGGVFRFFRPKNCLNDQDKKIFPIIKENNLIVGLAELEQSWFEDGVIVVKNVAIDYKFQDKKYGINLLDKIFQYARDNKLALQLSSYVNKDKDEGSHNKIKHIIKQMFKKYPDVKVLDNMRKGVNFLNN